MPLGHPTQTRGKYGQRVCGLIVEQHQGGVPQRLPGGSRRDRRGTGAAALRPCERR